ncbi:hypothetical protein B0J17DRAFT_633203 [Rhizoctonia solani]|nr:hypothetical protein B0J17DRAFT_633203 [Rhizoctonia solani]
MSAVPGPGSDAPRRGRNTSGRATIASRIFEKKRDENVLKAMWWDTERGLEEEFIQKMKGKFGLSQYDELADIAIGVPPEEGKKDPEPTCNVEHWPNRLVDRYRPTVNVVENQPTAQSNGGNVGEKGGLQPLCLFWYSPLNRSDLLSLRSEKVPTLFNWHIQDGKDGGFARDSWTPLVVTTGERLETEVGQLLSRYDRREEVAEGGIRVPLGA